MAQLEYNARVHVKSKLHYFPLMKARLGFDRSALFRGTCFGRWLDLTYVQNEEGLVHYMLQNQNYSDDEHYDLPLIYTVNEHVLHFGRREFCLISGFKFGLLSFRKYRFGDITFRDRVFPDKIGEDLKSIDLLSLVEDEELFISLSELDSVRVCLLLSLEVIFMGHDLGSVVDDVFLRMVEDLDAWNDFPWGEHMWRELYAAIRNVHVNEQNGHQKALKMNPNSVPKYSLSGFVLCFKIWIIESSVVSDRWWSKASEGIPRGRLWVNHFPFQDWEHYGQLFPQDKKPNHELYPNRVEAQAKWFSRSNDFFNMYTPRAPPVVYTGLFGDYLKKLYAARAASEKDKGPFVKTVTKMVTLKDRVIALENLCEYMMILPKEIKSLQARVYKLETVINVLTKERKVSKKKHKDSTSGNQSDLGDKYWSDQDGEPFFEYKGSQPISENNDLLNGLVDALDDLADNDGVVELDNDCSQDDFVKEQKLEAEKQRVAAQKTKWLNKMKQEQNSMQGFVKSKHMKAVFERCVGTHKRKYVNVLRPNEEIDTVRKLVNIDSLKRQSNVLDESMVERCQDLKPWKEDLKRESRRIDKIHCNYYVEQFISTSGWSKCKFPWCTEVVVGPNFWDALLGIDAERVGWLLDEHIDLWVWYMWRFRQSSDDWSMVSCYFITILLQDALPLFYATNEIYPLAWTDVEQVFIPINETKSHWSLAVFHIQSGNVTFYDSGDTFDPEFRPFYLKMRSVLETKLPVVLEQTGVFTSKGIDPKSYSIKFTTAKNVPKQGGVFGDCGVFLCMFLYRLAHKIPLTVEDPIQAALAYREKMVQFYFNHKIIYPC